VEVVDLQVSKRGWGFIILNCVGGVVLTSGRFYLGIMAREVIAILLGLVAGSILWDANIRQLLGTRRDLLLMCAVTIVPTLLVFLILLSLPLNRSVVYPLFTYLLTMEIVLACCLIFLSVGKH